jgi:4-carboxymuconolactone decarboxylase
MKAQVKNEPKKKSKPAASSPAPKKRVAEAYADPVFSAGLAVRREMFGADGAERQIEAASDFIWPMQDYVTRHCFGETWTRPLLSRKIRSMLTLGMLVAQGRPHELKVHVRGAIKNGVSKEEISEVLLHAMIYCGVPKAVEGFRSAQEVLREIGLE